MASEYSAKRAKAAAQAEAAGKAAEHFAAAADKLAAKASKAARHAEALERMVRHGDPLDVWTQTKPEGRKPKLSRERLAEIAVRLADTEGLEALSMRRLAAELGVGTMSLYHYVRTKDELLTLVLDTVTGELVVLEHEPWPTGWREAMTLLAERSLASLRRHPWVIDITDDPPIGPNGTRHFDQSLRAAASYPGSFEDQLDLIMTIDEYVFGYVTFERNNLRHLETAASAKRMIDYIEGLLARGGYPQLSALKQRLGLGTAWDRIHVHARDPHRFERNLARLLDGFAARVDEPPDSAARRPPRAKR